MTKKAFLAQLQAALKGLPQREINNTLSFYSEMIDDRMEEGLSEEDAVADLGSIETIVSKVTEFLPLSKTPTNKTKPERRLKVWEIVLLILGFPIWASLGIAAIAVLFSLWGSLWALIISLWAVFASLVGTGFGCLVGGLYFLCTGHVLSGLCCIAGGLVCAGLGVFFFYGCKYATKGLVLLTKKTVQWIQSIFRRRG